MVNVFKVRNFIGKANLVRGLAGQVHRLCCILNCKAYLPKALNHLRPCRNFTSKWCFVELPDQVRQELCQLRKMGKSIGRLNAGIVAYLLLNDCRRATICKLAGCQAGIPNTMADTMKIILLADDDPEDQEILEDILNELEPSIQIHKVDSGKEAVDFLMKGPNEVPHLIILDYSMPIFNAAEVLEKIGGDQRLLRVPKVVWSSSRQPEHVQRCLDKGASRYFVKPNKMSELTDIARQMLSFCA